MLPKGGDICTIFDPGHCDFLSQTPYKTMIRIIGQHILFCYSPCKRDTVGYQRAGLSYPDKCINDKPAKID